jgi:epoxide hydrolase 4
LGKERAIIVGHDWGGVVCWSIAMSEPNIVEKLVVMNAPHPGLSLRNNFMNIAQLQKSWYIFFFLLQRVPEKVLSANGYAFLKHVFESTIKRKNGVTQSDIEQYVSSWSKEGGLSGGINYYRANLGADFWENLSQNITFPKIKRPTLVIWGEDDAFLGRELIENIGASIEAPFSLKFISNCGHWVQQEAADEVNQIMKEFLKG